MAMEQVTILSGSTTTSGTYIAVLIDGVIKLFWLMGWLNGNNMTIFQYKYKLSQKSLAKHL